MKRVGAPPGLALLLVAFVSLCLSVTASAHGGPASDYLHGQSIFLPLGAKIDQDAVTRLQDVVRAADESGFTIKAAIILRPQDLGASSSLFRKPQRYAEFLGQELSRVYRERLLIVTPNGFGYSVHGDPDPKVADLLAGGSPPGENATKEVQAATATIRRLAAAAGHRIVLSEGGSEPRDRLTIAAAATAGIALIAGILLYRREHTDPT